MSLAYIYLDLSSWANWIYWLKAWWCLWFWWRAWKEGLKKALFIDWIMAQAEDVTWTDVFREQLCRMPRWGYSPLFVMALSGWPILQRDTHYFIQWKWVPFCSYFTKLGSHLRFWLAFAWLFISDWGIRFLDHSSCVFHLFWQVGRCSWNALICISQRGEFSICHHCLGLCVTECVMIWG